MILITKLILAHLIGDFLLQPSSWVKHKEERKLRSKYLYLHSILHGAIIMVLVWDWMFLPWAILLALVHGMIDASKLLLQKENTKRLYFFADQLAHIISIYVIYYARSGFSGINLEILNEANFVLATMLVFLTMPSSFAIKMFIAKWSPQTEENDDDSLAEAGKYIGILERLFVFAFVTTGHWEAVGFLLAAKSVFRFGDLKDSKDRKLTEYILIGTLISFGIAILAGISYNVLTVE